jgi:hypothetical protein
MTPWLMQKAVFIAGNPFFVQAFHPQKSSLASGKRPIKNHAFALDVKC